MKSIVFILSLAFNAGLYACQSPQKSNEQAATQPAAQPPATDPIVRDTVTNRQGDTLVMAYDNTNLTATFMLAGEEIKLKQDTTASGIKYSNAEYEYTEHQGKMTLKKRAKIVFSKP